MRKPIVGGEEMDAAVEALADQAMAVLDERADEAAADETATGALQDDAQDAAQDTTKSFVDESVTAEAEAEVEASAMAGEGADESETVPVEAAAADASADGAMEMVPVLEALLFVSPDPLTVERCVSVLGQGTKAQVRQALALMAHDLDQRGSSLQIVQVAGGYRMVTRPEYAVWLRRLDKQKPQAKLSRSAVEALAIIAYRQPVVRGELEKIRGVETSGVIRTLMERKLVRIVGRKDEPGRPIMYGTTKHFLEHFGLRDLSELPPLQEFKELGEGDQSSLLEEMMVGNTDAEGAGLVEAPESAVGEQLAVEGESSLIAASDETLSVVETPESTAGDVSVLAYDGEIVQASSAPTESEFDEEIARATEGEDFSQPAEAHAGNGNGNGNGHGHLHASLPSDDVDAPAVDAQDPVSVADPQ